jgi:UDP-N-acetylmuramoylalanine--D-glutamate ligase
VSGGALTLHPATRLPDAWRRGEIAVVGLGRSGRAVASVLATAGASVYASDAGRSSALDDTVRELSAAGIDAEAGRHDLDRVRRSALVVVSPGVPPDAPPFVAARDAGVPVVSEVEVALRLRPDLRYIGVTGTNGKTTTTAMVAHLLRALGQSAVAAGNIGTALSAVVTDPAAPDWIALELSSFQLHDTPSVRPAVGVLTNLSPNHLDRYASVEEYYADKALLFRNADAGSRWVINADDPAVEEMARGIPGEVYRFTVEEDGSGEARLEMGGAVLSLFGEPFLDSGDFPLLGAHNVANALAAALAVSVADDRHRVPDAATRMGLALQEFGALEHRIEPVGEWGGVQWINDSKSTNVASTLVALRGMRRPTVLLLGGRHKGEPYTTLGEELRRTVRRVIAFGEAAPLVRGDLEGVVPLDTLGSSFEAVVARAREVARPGDAVLLSPACSSYDMFANYEERGRTFKRMAAEQGEPGKRATQSAINTST